MDANAETRKIISRINNTDDYYKVLNVDKKATTAQIKKEYRLIARIIHPDKCSLSGAEDAFKKLNAAHKCLSNEESRQHYDLTGGELNESGPGASPFGPDIFAEMFRNERGQSNFRTINLSDLLPKRLSALLNIPGVVPLLSLFVFIFAFRFLAWILSLSMYILPALYLTPAKVRWWLVLLILILSLFGYI